MATEIISTLMKLTLNGGLSKGMDLGDTKYTFDKQASSRFTHGAGALQANNVFSDTRTIAAESTDALDLAGTLTNAVNETITFASIKGLYVFAHAANTADLKMGGDATNPFDTIFDTGFDDAVILIKPGTWWAFCNPNAAGYVVTASTADILQFANAGLAAISYDIVLLGD